jgi:hypothetical protein
MDWVGDVDHNSAAVKAIRCVVLHFLRPTESAVAGHGQFEPRRQSPDRLILNRVVTNTAYTSDASNAASDNHKLENRTAA